MNKKPIFSVIVPIYKVEKYLNKCIDSILAQTFDGFELILVDDGSPDNCPSMCDDYAKRDERVTVIHKKNGGLVKARETGILAAAGRYVCWVDGDDFVSEELLEHLYRIIQSHDAPDMICYDYCRYYEKGNDIRLKASGIENSPVSGMYDKKRLEQEIYPYMLQDSRKRFATTSIYGSAWSKCFRRELIAAHYCKEPGIRQGEDTAFVYECIYFAETLFCSDKVLYYYRQLDDSMIHSYDRLLMDRSQAKIHYLRAHTGILSESLSRQVENLYVADLLIAVFALARRRIPVFKARREVKEMLRRTGVLRDIRMSKAMPLHIKVAIRMLRCHLYLTVLTVAYFLIALEKMRKSGINE